MRDQRVLITICARGGSKGVPSKNTRPLLGKPLIAYTIEQARSWGKAERIVVSTDSKEIAMIAESAGAEVPFERPAHMATDTAGKLPVIVHALKTCEQLYDEKYDAVVDLDPTSPMRTVADIEKGWETFLASKRSVCFSVVKARKNPYFNMVEKDATGKAVLVKSLAEKHFASRQAAPQVWDMNASIYFFKREFLLSDPGSLWQGDPGFFEMLPQSCFDIDEERDFIVVEALMNHYLKGDKV